MQHLESAAEIRRLGCNLEQVGSRELQPSEGIAMVLQECLMRNLDQFHYLRPPSRIFLVEADRQMVLHFTKRMIRHFDTRNYCSFAGFGMIIMCKAYIRPKGFGVWGLGFGVWGL